MGTDSGLVKELLRQCLWVRPGRAPTPGWPRSFCVNAFGSGPDRHRLQGTPIFTNTWHYRGPRFPR
eukprot:9196437-Lingulodinium_polyedra.AAC.1